MEKRITGYTQLIGLIAYPIRHSNSPKMHNEAFAKLGLDYAYLAFEVDNLALKDAVKGIKALKMVGANVSMPNKTTVQQYLDEISKEAQLCNAVNTIVNKDGKLIGYITDGAGYIDSLKDNNIDIIGKKITVVGAGGAGTAIQIQCAFDKAREISIFNRKDEFWNNAKETVEKIKENTNCKVNLYDLADLDKLKEEISTSDIFANATSVGMGELENLTYIPDETFFKKNLIVTDVIYHPEETKMLSIAKRVGCKTINGTGMMLFQGARAFELWTGQQMPIEHIKKVLGINNENL